ncbi:hypothetical protein [Christiangramia crocea]|uniref:Uncharacterized protein n=1 Tax=Christiangramia crocea TaxID=2904124 RepID=A0A9X1UVS7_9FLAO|nr:hypothetical protein [Gramella crocea]MCG9970991.1 hypothetical protein [Gramella crocea]
MRFYQNCDEISKWNFDQIQKTQDLRFLVYGYEYGELKFSKGEKEKAKEVWDNILNEYSEKTGNNKTLLYFELIYDRNELEDRVYYGSILLTQLSRRSFSMDKDIKKEYIDTLRRYQFLLNEGKPFIDELKRLNNQMKVVKMKLEQKNKAVEDFEEKNFSKEGISTIDLKIKIQRICKIQLDLKNISVTEWLGWINEALNSKQAA